MSRGPVRYEQFRVGIVERFGRKKYLDNFGILLLLLVCNVTFVLVQHNGRYAMVPLLEDSKNECAESRARYVTFHLICRIHTVYAQFTLIPK